jgi:ATP-dependent DNA helicase RecG
LNLTSERLRQVLELEQARGYRDEAVMGGLDRLLRNVAMAGPRLSGLLSQSYAALGESERVEWIRSVLAELDEGEAETPPPPPVARKPRHLPTRSYEEVQRQIDVPITSIKGISAKLAAKFGKLGVAKVRDLLYYFPHRHLDYSGRSLISELEVGHEQTIIATVWEAAARTVGRRMRSTEAVVGDESGNIRVIWFNQPYLAKKLAPNTTVVISGRVGSFKGSKVFESPEWEPLESRPLAAGAARLPPRGGQSQDGAAAAR